MKKVCIFFIFIFVCINASSQILIDSISKFETSECDKINLPIIKAKSTVGDVYFLIDCGANFSIIDLYFYSDKFHYNNPDGENKIEFSSINSTFQLPYNNLRVKINGADYRFIHTSICSLNVAIKDYKIVGILGNDWLKINKAIINYRDRTLKITFPKR